MSFRGSMIAIGMVALFCMGVIVYGATQEVQYERVYVETNKTVDNNKVVKDSATGCLYIKTKSTFKTEVSPYYDEDGKIKGCGEM